MRIGTNGFKFNGGERAQAERDLERDNRNEGYFRLSIYIDIYA